MGRSIVRSKIFAKQNIPSTGGGGGGSAITVSDEGTTLTSNVNSFNFTGYGVTASAVGNAVTVTVDNHLAIQVKNGTGAPVTKGTICYLKTGSTSTTVPEILLSDATTEATSSKTLGMVHTTIPNGGIGLLVVNGELEGTGSEPLDTSMYTIGTKLWLGTTPGTVTSTPPTFPNHTVFIGHVTRSQSVNGRILVEIQNGFELAELHDTLFSGLNYGDYLIYDPISGSRPYWKNKYFYQTILNADLISLRNSATLIPNVTYEIIDSPGAWKIKITADSRNTFYATGKASIGLTFNCECFYDLDNNTLTRVYDPNNKNDIWDWLNISQFLWNNPDWAYNIINAQSQIIFANPPDTFLNNVLTNAVLVIDNGNSAVNNNIIENSIIDLQDSSSGPFSNNSIKDSNIFVEYPSGMDSCDVVGMGVTYSFGRITAVLNNREFYKGCKYKISEVSTFFATYSLDEPLTYDFTSKTLTLPLGNELWVGKVFLTMATLSTMYEIQQISNAPTMHLFTVSAKQVASASFVQFTNNTKIALPFSMGGNFKLSTPIYDYCIFDGRDFATMGGQADGTIGNQITMLEGKTY